LVSPFLTTSSSLTSNGGKDSKFHFIVIPQTSPFATVTLFASRFHKCAWKEIRVAALVVSFALTFKRSNRCKKSKREEKSKRSVRTCKRHIVWCNRRFTMSLECFKFWDIIGCIWSSLFLVMAGETITCLYIEVQ
jgi:hypothetical protein